MFDVSLWTAYLDNTFVMFKCTADSVLVIINSRIIWIELSELSNPFVGIVCINKQTKKNKNKKQLSYFLFRQHFVHHMHAWMF